MSFFLYFFLSQKWGNISKLLKDEKSFPQIMQEWRITSKRQKEGLLFIYLFIYLFIHLSFRHSKQELVAVRRSWNQAVLKYSFIKLWVVVVKHQMSWTPSEIRTHNLWFGWVGFGLDLVWFGLVFWHINYCRLFNVKSFLYIHIKYMVSKHTLWITFLNEPELIF